MKLSKMINPLFEITLAELTSQKLPIKLSFKIKTIKYAIRDARKIYEESRVELCEELADKDESGKAILKEDNNYKLSPESLIKLASELKELQDADVTLPTLSIDELSSAVLSADQLDLLDGLVVA